MFSSGVTPGVQLGADAAGTAIAPGMGINNLFSQVPTTGLSTNLGAIGSTPIPATTTTGAFADGINLTTANLAGGAGNIPLSAMDTSKIFNYTPPTAMDKITGAGTMLSDWAQANPSQALSSGLQGYQALNQPAPPLNLPVPFGVSLRSIFVSSPVAAISGALPVAEFVTVISLTALAVSANLTNSNVPSPIDCPLTSNIPPSCGVVSCTKSVIPPEVTAIQAEPV